MICVSIGDYGLDACRKAVRKCEKLRKQYADLVAEIRLDICGLNGRETFALFSEAKVPLIATTTRRNVDLCTEAFFGDAAYVDMNVFSYRSMPKETKMLMQGRKTKIILSFEDYQRTPELKELSTVYRQAVSLGADMVRIITTADSVGDAERVLELYEMQRKGLLGKQVPLIAFAMGDAVRYSRLEACMLGAPFLYCSLKKKHVFSPGVFLVDELEGLRRFRDVSGEVAIPASKSIAQRAIIASVLARGESEFHNFSHSHDIDTAVAVAKQFSDRVYIEKETLVVKGAYPFEKKKADSPFSNLLTNMSMQSGRTIFVGESGLLSRLCIPIVAQIGEQITLTGEGKLLDRPMYGCKEVMEELGASCVLTAEETLPALINGPLKGGDFTVSGKKGSQFISGLLMSLPLCRKDSRMVVEHPTSIPYILMTINVMKRFGIEVTCRSEADSLIFEIPGRQKYTATDMTFEGDWSSAANFIVLGAVFGDIAISGLNLSSIQADKGILELVERCGAVVERSGSTVLRVRRGHLKAFDCDVTDSPDILPSLAILAAFSEGESCISGIDHLKSLDSSRSISIFHLLKDLGIEMSVEEDVLRIKGSGLFHRYLEGKELRAGNFSSSGDHRLAMGLMVVSLGVNGKVTIDDTDCISKSFPQFKALFDSVVHKS